MRNTRLGPLGHEIKDGSAGRLATCAGRGGNSNKRFQRLVNRQALAERRIDKVEEVGVGVCCVEVHELGSVDDRTAAHSEERIGGIWTSPGDGLFDTDLSLAL